MIVSLALAAFCLLFCLLAFQLSATAGRLPALIAVLTLVPVLLQIRLDFQAPVSSTGELAAPPGWVGVLLLLGALYLVGFIVALPLYAAWSWRHRPIVAAAWMAGVLAGLWLLQQRVELFPGVLFAR
jgi:hypothetical protein